MHKFTLPLVGSINIYIASLLSPTYAIGRYSSERMAPTAE